MKYNSIFLVVLAIGICVTLVFAENITPAYAFLITVYDEPGSSPTSISRVGNFIWVGDSGTTSLYKYAVSDPTTLLATIVLPTAPFLSAPNSDSSRLYVFATTNLYEIDIVNNAVLRTTAHGCNTGFFDSENNSLWCGETDETVNHISLNTMAVVFSSTTLNAGASACDTIADLWYDAPTDTLFAGCIAGTQRFVAVEDITASGTPDFTVAVGGVRHISFNADQDNVAICSSSATVSAQLYNYTSGVGFSALWVQMLPVGTTSVCSLELGSLEYDTESNRFFIYAQAFNTINVFDATTGVSLFSNTLGDPNTAGGQVFVYSNTLSYFSIDGSVATYDWAVFDMTGIDLGSNGTPTPPSGSGGVDCTLPANAQILICRLGGDGSLVGAGNFIVGNVNGTTGLTPIICATGIVDCVANPNMKTNGVGYLLVTIALAIIIGILWVASRGDLNSIPTFIWFIATLAVVGAFTLMDLIDATFLVITAIIVVALAAAKVRGLFGGEFR